ncbi:MAG: hypothetical protein V3U19_03730 [Thermodesulfobacteriota bacterium]
MGLEDELFGLEWTNAQVHAYVEGQISQQVQIAWNSGPIDWTSRNVSPSIMAVNQSFNFGVLIRPPTDSWITFNSRGDISSHNVLQIRPENNMTHWLYYAEDIYFPMDWWLLIRRFPGLGNFAWGGDHMVVPNGDWWGANREWIVSADTYAGVLADHVDNLRGRVQVAVDFIVNDLSPEVISLVSGQSAINTSINEVIIPAIIVVEDDITLIKERFFELFTDVIVPLNSVVNDISDKITDNIEPDIIALDGTLINVRETIDDNIIPDIENLEDNQDIIIDSINTGLQPSINQLEADRNTVFTVITDDIIPDIEALELSLSEAPTQIGGRVSQSERHISTMRGTIDNALIPDISSNTTNITDHNSVLESLLTDASYIVTLLNSFVPDWNIEVKRLWKAFIIKVLE